MIQYKSYRFLDGKPKWVIVNEDGKIINKKPNKKDLERLDHEIQTIGKRKIKDIYYNETNTCDKIKKDGKKCDNKLTPGKAVREYVNDKWTGKWLCRSCYDLNPGSTHSLIKSIADIRNDNLDPFSKTGKGYICEQITCKARKIKNLNSEDDNFNSPIDHTRDPELGIIQSKGATYNKFERTWTVGTRTEFGKIFDNAIIYCIGADMKIVERVYIFPWEEIINRLSGINITNSSIRSAWYYKYRVDEKPYNDAYHSLDEKDLKGLRNVKKFIAYLHIIVL